MTRNTATKPAISPITSDACVALNHAEINNRKDVQNDKEHHHEARYQSDHLKRLCRLEPR